jgi:hypothetical protein
MTDDLLLLLLLQDLLASTSLLTRMYSTSP